MDGAKRAFYYYLANQEAINEGHMGEYVAICDNRVIGYYQDRLDGFDDMIAKGHEQGTFNVTLCHPVGEPEAMMGFVPVLWNMQKRPFITSSLG
jgi:hypothetical protein